MKTIASLLLLGFLGLSLVCFRRDEPKEPEKKADVRFEVFEMDRIEADLKSGRITLRQAADRLAPILVTDPDLSPVFAITPGENERHKAAHWCMGWMFDHPRYEATQQQYERLTGCRYLCFIAYEKLP